MGNFGIGGKTCEVGRAVAYSYLLSSRRVSKIFDGNNGLLQRFLKRKPTTEQVDQQIRACRKCVDDPQSDIEIIPCNFTFKFIRRP